nr:hypothetical protein [Tanacetum cinerariifolium]
MFNKNKKTPKSKTLNSRLQPSAPHLTPDPNFQLSGLSPPIRFRSFTFEYNTQLPQPPQNNNTFYQNRPFNPPYNNQNAFYNSPSGLYRPTIESSTSSLPNQPYSPINPTDLDMNIEALMELSIREAEVRGIAQLKREKLEIQRRTLELAEGEKRDRDIFYNSAIDTTLPPIQQEKLLEMKMEIKARYNLYYYFKLSE